MTFNVLCTGQRAWGCRRAGSFQDVLLPFFVELIGCFVAKSAQKCSDDLFVLLFLHFVSVGITPSYPECQHWTDPLFVSFFVFPNLDMSHRADSPTRPLWSVCRALSVWVYYEKSLGKSNNKKNKWLTRTTKNGELFSFDLIIYFCVVEPLGLYRFGYFGVGGSCRIISLLPFRCRAPLTHSHTHLYFNTKPRGGWRTWRSSNGWVHVHLWPLFSFYLLLFWRPYLSKACVWEKGEEVWPLVWHSHSPGFGNGGTADPTGGCS